MYLHTIILTLFRPFLQGPQRDQKLRGFTSADSSPSAIYAASVNQMKHLVLQHHLDHPGKLFSNFSYAGYMQLCNDIAGVEASSSSSSNSTKSRRGELRFYFDICMCFLQDAYLQYALAMPIAQGLLCMALESRLIRACKAREILKCLEERGKHHNRPLLETKMMSSPSAAHQAQIIVNFSLAVVDAGAAQASSLASQLGDLVLYDEFTYATSDDDDEEDNDDGYEEEKATRRCAVGCPEHYRALVSDVCVNTN